MKYIIDANTCPALFNLLNTNSCVDNDIIIHNNDYDIDENLSQIIRQANDELQSCIIE